MIGQSLIELEAMWARQRAASIEKATQLGTVYVAQEYDGPVFLGYFRYPEGKRERATRTEYLDWCRISGRTP